MSASSVRCGALPLPLVVCALGIAIACHDRSDTPPAEALKPSAQEAREMAAEPARPPEKQLDLVPVPEAVLAEGPSPSAAQLPVAEDFQAETATTILRANYLAELDKLETELQADEN